MSIEVKNSVQETIKKLEAQEQTLETVESIRALKEAFNTEVVESVAEFKAEDDEVEKIEQSINLKNPELVKEVEGEMKVEETLQNLDTKVDDLKKESLILKQEAFIDTETIRKIESIVFAEHAKEVAEEELHELEKNRSEMSPDAYRLKTKCAEISILKAKGEILTSKEGVSDELINKFKGNIQNKAFERKISAESSKEKEFNRVKELLFHNVDLLNKKAQSYGYNLISIQEIENSTDPKEEQIYNDFDEFSKKIEVIKNFDFLCASSPNLVLDLLLNNEVSEPMLIKGFFDECLGNKESSSKKLIDVVLTKIINTDNSSEIVSDIEYRLKKDKQEALKKLTVEEFLDSWEKDPPETKGWEDSEVFKEKLSTKIDALSKVGDSEGITNIKNTLDRLNSNSSSVPSFYDTYPKWLKKINLNETDSIKVLTKQLSEDEFRYYFDKGFVPGFIPFHLLPEYLSQEEKNKLAKSVFSKEDLNTNDIEEYAKFSNKSIMEVIDENPRALLVTVKDTQIRKTVLHDLMSKYENAIENTEDQIKYSRTKNVLDSFILKDNPQELPPFIFEVLENFKNKFGTKGENLIALAISAYGIDHPEYFSQQMKSIENILSKYNPDTIPEGAKVSMGIEYEVTRSITDIYDNENALDYVTNINLVSQSAGINKGKDGMHEIALKPTYNPYMLMAEVKLLQDAQFLDFNFKKYNHIDTPRGYHLSMVGDTGLYVEKDIFFLNNAMTMAQLPSFTAGKEIRSTKNIYSKYFENFSDSTQQGERCEIKGMATDSVEQFEKSIITAHHAGIAIQLYNKYIPKVSEFSDIGKSAEEFELILTNTKSLISPFETDQERDLVYQWAKFRKSIEEAILQHNESFIDSEFIGGFLNKDDEYVETGEYIDLPRNKRLLVEQNLDSVKLKNDLNISIDDIYKNPEADFVNTLTRINNIFLKPPQATENSAVNAVNVLNTMKKEGYRGIMDGEAQESIFENGGKIREGYYYSQGASEEMIIHKAQIILNEFNRNMDALLQKKGIKRPTNQEELIPA